MKKFNKKEIDGAREYFRSQGFKEVQVNLDNYKFSYFVLPQALEPKLKNFVYRCTGNPGDGYVFGISDSVHETHRPYAVAHEFIEFNEIGIDTPKRCSKALESELKLVPEEIKPDYLKMRKDFFENLIAYCLDKPEHYTKADLKEFRQSLAKLKKVVK